MTRYVKCEIPAVYTASKVRHGWRWRELRDQGVNVIASWIFLGEGPLATQKEYENLWIACVHEARIANACLLYAEEGDVLKGALIEAGACLAAGGSVIQVGDCESLRAGGKSDASFRRHPRWFRAASVDEAMWMAGVKLNPNLLRAEIAA